MTSEFKKLLSREFGKEEYNAYFEYTSRVFQRKRLEKEETRLMLLKEESLLKTYVFRNMEEILNHRTKKQLYKSNERLLECMEVTMDINGGFFMVFIAYLLSSFMLLTLFLHPVVSITAMCLLTAVFLHKAMEYIVNKYCYVDAYLILIYKNVLKKLLE